VIHVRAQSALSAARPGPSPRWDLASWRRDDHGQAGCGPGGTLGQERTVVPLLAVQTFHLAALSSALTFILAFGAVKAVTNFFAGTLSDRFGRKPVLVAG
jgi:MFS family permease